MSDENEWTLSFNPRTEDEIDVDALKEALSPFALSVSRKSPHRYEILLDDELPDYPKMGEVITEVIMTLGAIHPEAIVVGHVLNEPEFA